MALVCVRRETVLRGAVRDGEGGVGCGCGGVGAIGRRAVSGMDGGVGVGRLLSGEAKGQRGGMVRRVRRGLRVGDGGGCGAWSRCHKGDCTERQTRDALGVATRVGRLVGYAVVA